MRKFIFTGIAAVAVLVGVASLMFTAAASAHSTHAKKVTKVTVAMHDPGCHWFLGGTTTDPTYSKTKTVKGAVKLLNIDENTLNVAAPDGSTVQVKVGKTVKLTAKGAYSITMVKQQPDDNTLTLTIK